MANSLKDVADLLTVLVDPTKSKVPPGGYASALNGKWANVRVGTLDPQIWTLDNGIIKPVPEATKQIVRSFPASSKHPLYWLLQLEETRVVYSKIKSLAKSYHENVFVQAYQEFGFEGRDALDSMMGQHHLLPLDIVQIPTVNSRWSEGG